MVLWVVGLLAFLLTVTMLSVRQNMEVALSQRMLSRAGQLAEMGLAVALHPMVEPGDPLLEGKVNAAERYEVAVDFEEGRVNVNAFLREERKELLERLLRHWTGERVLAQGLVDKMMDWVDADHLRRATGAEAREYERDSGMPFNRPFASLDELRLVQGMEELDNAAPQWSDHLTVWGSGKVDLVSADAEVIAALTGAPLEVCARFSRTIRGEDGKAHTEDDLVPVGVDEALGMLGVAAGEREGLADIFALEGTLMRVRSIGWVGDFGRGWEAVVNKGGDSGIQILLWKERAGRSEGER